MKRAGRGMVLAAATLLLTAAAPKTVGWTHTVALLPDGSHLIGNPAAKVRVTEYQSYQCPECAAFAVQSDGELQLGYVASGKVAVEIRHLVQGPVDLAAAMLADCGGTDKFLLNHSALLRSLPRWQSDQERAGAAQKLRWTSGSLLARGRAIAGDMGFYDVMASRGFDRSAVDACLADQAQATRIGAQSKAGYALGIKTAPAFLINDTLQGEARTWADLRPLIDASI